ncbi:MAG: M12 family metallo-peptidase [Saprospiraceae bacterium]
MRILFTLTLSMMLSGLFAQTAPNFWVYTPEAQLKSNPDLERDLMPTEYLTYELNLPALKEYLKDAPEKGSQTDFTMRFPLKNGQFTTFRVWEAPVMHPDLAARFPNIKTYEGRSLKGNYSISFGYGDHGFHGSIREGKNFTYIDPYAISDTRNYQVYDVKNTNIDAANGPAAACGFNPAVHGSDLNEKLDMTYLKDDVQGKVNADKVELRTYTMVMACTGEFANRQGGTTSGVLSAFNTMIDRLNQIYQMEFAATFIIHPETDKVIFLNPVNDPYPQGNEGGEILGINANVVNARINRNSYDISHCFTARCNDVGGIASLGSLCNQNASGVTCHSGGSVSFTVVNITAHEVGHQFSCSHTWDNCGSPQRSTPYEPGSGTTIMSYAGLCGAQNIVNGINDDYFHVNSLEQAYFFTHVANGNSCADVTVTENHYPVVSLPYINGFYIPNGTPFVLEGAANDEDGDDLTYCWEQFDQDPIVANIGFPVGNSPIYRSYYPGEDSIRYFPRIGTILGYQDTLPWEMLARYARDMTFRLTVRDNDPNAGGVRWEEVAFHLDDNVRPFEVTWPNDTVESIKVGERVNITWEVADSYESPVNCKAVNILLSLDGGYTWPITLSENTQNDGSELVFIPETTLTDRARIKVEAADNIFFNVSSKNFDILDSDAPGYTVQISPTFHYACLPEVYSLDIKTASLLNYDSTLNVEVIGLPNGATASFTNTTIQPGESISLEVDLPNGLGTGFLNFDVLIYPNTGDTILTRVDMELVSNDFGNIALLTPENGADGIQEVPTFSWTGAPDADYYQIQVATNPSFAPGTIVFDVTNLVDTTFTPTVLMDENTPYYWRIRPFNICGAGDYRTPVAFHTLAKVCNSYIALEDDDERIPIPGQGTPTVVSPITILTNGTINDVNIPYIRGSYEPITSLRINLVSPDSTSIILFEKRCSGSVFNMGFDDAITNRNPCPANTGRVIGPQDTLSTFNGKRLDGTWSLEFEIINPGFGGGGSLEEWEIEFCADLAPNAPYLITNNELPVKPGFGRIVTNAFLEVRDSSSGPDDLVFTLVTIPENGKLSLAGRELKVGDQFRQTSINVKNVYYEHDGSSTTTDNFTFTVRDDEGGWLATPQFNFVMDENAVVSTEDADFESEIKVFPNPANEIINIDLGLPYDATMTVQLLNIAGQAVRTEYFDGRNQRLSIPTAKIAEGMYILQIKGEDITISKKINIQR